MVQRFEMSIWEKDDGDFVYYNDYAALEVENAKLKEALRNMMEATEAVDEWKSGEAPSFLGGYAFDLVKVARGKAREVLGDD